MSVPWKQWEGLVVDGSFPLRRHLGGTGRSAVFLTGYSDPEPRDAAIKLVLAEARDAELLAQWERAAQLSHPHLLRLLQMGRSEANQAAFDYAVTEYADENLAAVLAERPLTAGEAREMLQPALDALAYIHAEGLVHGHLKPANFMAIGDQLKLSVDGISTVGDLGTEPGQPGAYDPPEFRARGCSPVGDIWSLGMTLVEALTQRLPRQADPKQEPSLPETLPEEFVSLARSCLHPDPRRRATLGDLAAQLRRIFSEPEKQRPVEQDAGQTVGLSVELAADPRKRRVAVLVAGIGFAVAAILAAPRLFHRPATTTAVEPAAVPPAPGRQAPKPETPQTVEGTGIEKKPSPLRPAPSPTPVPGGSVPATESVPAGKGARGTMDARLHATIDWTGVVHQVLPDVPEEARRTIRGKVTIGVRASVDPSGHVTDAKLESGRSRYLADLTLQAARQWVFKPGNDGAGASEWLLRFELTRTGTVVQPSRVSH